MHAEINGKRIEHGQQADYTVYYHYAHVNAAQETPLLFTLAPVINHAACYNCLLYTSDAADE